MKEYPNLFKAIGNVWNVVETKLNEVLHRVSSKTRKFVDFSNTSLFKPFFNRKVLIIKDLRNWNFILKYWNTNVMFGNPAREIKIQEDKVLYNTIMTLYIKTHIIMECLLGRLENNHTN